jgi:hypothetical protein
MATLGPPRPRADGAIPDEPEEPAEAAAAASRQWRTAWRIHFYSGVFALPFVALMALTGLVILYTQPVQDLTEGDIRKVEVGSGTVSYEAQVAAVEEAFPEAEVVSVTTPNAPDRATIVGLEGGDQHTAGNEAFVDPYTGEVLGTSESGGTLVGLANRLHGFLNIESVTVGLSTVSALWDAGPLMREYVVFDLVLELLGVWALVLVFSGLFLWWPRRSRSKAKGTAGGTGSVLGIRRGVAGLALEPDGAYLAVGPLASPLASGDTFPVTLSFRDADDVTVDATVRRGPS